MAKSTGTTRAHSPAAMATPFEERFAELERQVGLLMRVPDHALAVREVELREAVERENERSEEQRRAEHRRQAPVRQAAFEQFAAAHLAVHASLAAEPVAMFRFYSEWCHEKRVPSMGEGEFQRAVMGLDGVEWSERAVVNAVGRAIPGYLGCSLSNNPAADLERITAEADRADRDRLQRESSAAYEISSRDEAMEARRLRDEGLAVLAKRERGR